MSKEKSYIPKARVPAGTRGVAFTIRGIPWKLYKVRDLLEKANAMGWCCPLHRYIALDANLFFGRDDWDLLSTLYHELCHAWIGGSFEVIQHKDEETICDLVGQGVAVFLHEWPKIKPKLLALPVTSLDQLYEEEDKKDEDDD